MLPANSATQQFNVLLVEDNEDDVLLTEHAFKKIPISVTFQVARNGVEALQLLRRENGHEEAPVPDLILLDLNMPCMDGRQLLAELKQDERFKTIPAIILTTSSAEDDIAKAYGGHASAYMTKPIELKEFAHRMRCFANFWLGEVAVLPDKRS